MNHSRVRSIFTGIYNTNHWGCLETISGPGSTIARTSKLRGEFQDILFNHGIESLMDLGCGDFNWMRGINLRGIRYFGCDIVLELVECNHHKYASETVHFTELDMLSSKLPKLDMIFCRDVLVHLSNDLILASLRNIKASGSTYLMATTYPDVKETVKSDVGGWRPVNLCDEKFGLPTPMKLVVEGSAPSFGRKCMGVWYIGDL